MTARYAHTNIVTRDWKRLADFYIEVFGCTPVPPERDQSGAWLERGTGVPNAALRGMHLRLPGHGADGPTLEVYQYSRVIDRAGDPAPNREGLGHLAFEVDDVDRALEDVLARGGAQLGEVVTREVAGVGTITFTYAADPDGNVLELQHWERP